MTDKGKSLPRHQDKQDNYHTQTHAQTQMRTRRQIFPYIGSLHTHVTICIHRHTQSMRIMCASFHMPTYRHNRHTHPGLLMRGHQKGGCMLRWELISCWKMLFTVFTAVSLNCQPLSSGFEMRVWEYIFHQTSMMWCIKNITYDKPYFLWYLQSNV